MKKIFGTFLALLTSGILYSQNVGINATGGLPDASAGLDVSFTDKGFIAPRVALTAANTAGPITLPATGLIVYNTATAGTGQNQVFPGYYYNRGTSGSPLWVKFDGRMIFHASSTVGVSLNTNGVVTLVPGTAITFTLPAGISADVNIYAYSGMSINPTLTNQYAIGDLIIYQNGAAIANGGWNRCELSAYNRMLTTSFVCRESLSAGTYTYDLRGNRFAGNTALIIGNNCATQVSCAEMTIEVVFK